MEVTTILKLDYTLTSAEERLELVNKILEENKEPNEAYLEILAEYLVIPIEREERRQHKILTDNRMATVNKRETSFEGLVSQLENGEDGIYNLVNENFQDNYVERLIESRGGDYNKLLNIINAVVIMLSPRNMQNVHLRNLMTFGKHILFHYRIKPCGNCYQE